MDTDITVDTFAHMSRMPNIKAEHREEKREGSKRKYADVDVSPIPFPDLSQLEDHRKIKITSFGGFQNGVHMQYLIPLSEFKAWLGVDTEREVKIKLTEIQAWHEDDADPEKHPQAQVDRFLQLVEKLTFGPWAKYGLDLKQQAEQKLLRGEYDDEFFLNRIES